MFLLIIGLVVLGPEKLPDAIRRVARVYSELKRMSSGVQSDLRKVMDEPIKEMMNTTNSMKSLFTDTASEFQNAAKDTFDPDFVPFEIGLPEIDGNEDDGASDDDSANQIDQTIATDAGELDGEQTDDEQSDDDEIAQAIQRTKDFDDERKKIIAQETPTDVNATSVLDDVS